MKRIAVGVDFFEPGWRADIAALDHNYTAPKCAMYLAWVEGKAADSLKHLVPAHQLYFDAEFELTDPYGNSLPEHTLFM